VKCFRHRGRHQARDRGTHPLHGDKSGNLEWFAWYFDQGLMTWDEAQRQLEVFARHVIPEFDD